MFRHIQCRTQRFLMNQIACQWQCSIKNRTLCCSRVRPSSVCLQRHPRTSWWSNSRWLIPLPSTTSSRQFWGVSVAFNQVDPDRVRLAGPDRAAAEWILRNGGSVKWDGGLQRLRDYNLLPSTNFENYKIAEIDLTATDVIGIGFQHLENLKHVTSIKLHGCRTIMDDALGNVHFVKDTLKWLEISRCPMITDKGLENLQVLKNLETLVIYDLIELRNFDESISKLRRDMPWVEIITDDPLLKPQEE